MDVTYDENDNQGITQDIEEILRNDISNSQDDSLDHIKDLEGNLKGEQRAPKNEKGMFSSSMRVNMQELELHEDSDEFMQHEEQAKMD